ncbi:NAD(P)-dependent oxidoreductase, partial [Candidatus Bathyarchaeota archaeon]|nr:NAD(P)-dependent oxidoreductase [Candidatus Bathyarchaeota archaeon]
MITSTESPFYGHRRVTGGSGFLGSHVIKELEARGHTCVNFDRMCLAHGH